MFHFDLKSCVTWVETKTFKLKKKKTFIVLVTQSVTGKRGNLCSIFAKAVNKQNTSKLLWYKLYFKIIWFSNHHFQNDFDFKSPLFRWFDFDFKIINIWWFCPSLQIMLLYYFTVRLRSHRTMLCRLCSIWVYCESSVCIAMLT